MWKAAYGEPVLGRGRALSWANTEGAAIHSTSFSEEAADTGDGDAPLSSVLLPFCLTACSSTGSTRPLNPQLPPPQSALSAGTALHSSVGAEPCSVRSIQGLIC